MLESSTHLLEIDLLREGEHTVAASLEALQERGTWDCLVCLHRSKQFYRYEYWFNYWTEPLPTIQVPLTPDFPDIDLDLQAVFNQSYDGGLYHRRIDYQENPYLPLEGEKAVWVETLLREKGYRPS